jgi:uncharacterized repeat protein (TIGR03803 family)
VSTGTLIQGSDGNLYGTASEGGAYGEGTVIKMTPSGALSVLYSFGYPPEGSAPWEGVIQASDGNFYGTTSGGGNSNYGTIYRVTPQGVATTIHYFDGADGEAPLGILVQGDDGSLYGVAESGGSSNCGGYGCGTIYRITLGGAFTELYSFCSQSNCTDGISPTGGLVQGVDGNFYGTTQAGGSSTNTNCSQRGPGCGTVFRITPAGAFAVLYSFCSQTNCPDGGAPHGSLIQSTDGSFYGTTRYGGSAFRGTVYKISPAGAETVLYSFCSLTNCDDGSAPAAGLVQATDGNFYGTTQAGGTGDGMGTIFRITPAGTLTVLHSFNGGDGDVPAAGLVQATDGNLYGVAEYGGQYSDGTVFRLSGPTPQAVQFVPVTPCRLVDTRSDGGPIQGNASRTFNLPQYALSKGCGDLSSASVYSLNVTLVPQNGAPVSYLTLWPAGELQPLVSTMNSLDGRTKANAAIVPAGASGAVSVFVTDTANVVLDIDGYFAPPSAQTLQFYPLPPCRLADTRKDNFPRGLGTPHLSQGVARDFPVLSADSCNIPPSARAYSLNFTAIPYPSLGHPLAYLEVWPTDQQPQHPVSTLNNPTATYVANAAIVPAGTDGKITAYASDDTDLAIDINGYFAAPGQNGLSLYPAVPCRVIDTRKVGDGHPFTGALSPPVDVVDSPRGIPNTAQAYVFNATVVPSPNLSYLTLWPDSQDQPVVSTLNAADGWITSNMAIVPNLNGKIDAYAAGMTQLILDISSYFAP